MHSKGMKIVLFILIIANLVCMVTILHNVRLDKIPFLGDMILGLEKRFAVEAQVYDEPITVDMLHSEPKDWPSDEYWFNFINAYSLRILKRYMKKNQLAIVPKRYELRNTMRIEELLDVLDFVSVEEA